MLVVIKNRKWQWWNLRLVAKFAGNYHARKEQRAFIEGNALRLSFRKRFIFIKYLLMLCTSQYIEINTIVSVCKRVCDEIPNVM